MEKGPHLNERAFRRGNLFFEAFQLPGSFFQPAVNHVQLRCRPHKKRVSI
jgi:hypothetical protein